MKSRPRFIVAHDGHLFVVARFAKSCDCLVTNEHGCQTRLNFADARRILGGIGWSTNA